MASLAFSFFGQVIGASNAGWRRWPSHFSGWNLGPATPDGVAGLFVSGRGAAGM